MRLTAIAGITTDKDWHAGKSPKKQGICIEERKKEGRGEGGRNDQAGLLQPPQTTHHSTRNSRGFVLAASL